MEGNQSFPISSQQFAAPTTELGMHVPGIGKGNVLVMGDYRLGGERKGLTGELGQIKVRSRAPMFVQVAIEEGAEIVAADVVAEAEAIIAEKQDITRMKNPELAVEGLADGLEG